MCGGGSGGVLYVNHFMTVLEVVLHVNHFMTVLVCEPISHVQRRRCKFATAEIQLRDVYSYETFLSVCGPLQVYGTTGAQTV